MRTLLIVAALATSAFAAPKVVEVEVQHDQFHYLAFLNTPPQATDEPGGWKIPDKLSKEWAAIGLHPGDIVRYVNGSPAGDRMIIGEGVTVLELERGGQRVFLRVTVHGKANRTVTLTQHAFERIVEQTHTGQLATPVQQNGAPSGVRIIDMLLSIHVELAQGDIVRTIDGTPIVSEAQLENALNNLKIGTTSIVFEREGREVHLDVVREAAIDVSRIRKLGAAHFEVPGTIVAAIDADSDLLTSTAKLVPNATGGTVHGIKVVALDPGALLGALGLQAGDVVLDVDGHSLDTMELAFSAEIDLRQASTITVHLQRRGKPLSIVYDIR
jgi:hypothetical protein